MNNSELKVMKCSEEMCDFQTVYDACDASAETDHIRGLVDHLQVDHNLAAPPGLAPKRVPILPVKPAPETPNWEDLEVKWQEVKDKKIENALAKAAARKNLEKKLDMPCGTLSNKDIQNELNEASEQGKELNEFVVNGEIKLLYKSPTPEEVKGKVEELPTQLTEDIKKELYDSDATKEVQSKEELATANEIKAVLNEVVNIQSTDEISKVLEKIASLEEIENKAKEISAQATKEIKEAVDKSTTHEEFLTKLVPITDQSNDENKNLTVATCEPAKVIQKMPTSKTPTHKEVQSKIDVNTTQPTKEIKKALDRGATREEIKKALDDGVTPDLLEMAATFSPYDIQKVLGLDEVPSPEEIQIMCNVIKAATTPPEGWVHPDDESANEASKDKSLTQHSIKDTAIQPKSSNDKIVLQPSKELKKVSEDTTTLEDVLTMVSACCKDREDKKEDVKSATFEEIQMVWDNIADNAPDDAMAMMTLHKLAMANNFVERYKVIEDKCNSENRYKVNLYFGNESYEGAGISVNAAKEAAASRAVTSTKYRMQEKTKLSKLTFIGSSDEQDFEKECRTQFTAASKLAQSNNFVEIYETIKETANICVVNLIFGDEIFKGTGSTVKEAKLKAAKRALAESKCSKTSVHTTRKATQSDQTVKFEVKSIEELTIGNAKITIESTSKCVGARPNRSLLSCEYEDKKKYNDDKNYIKLRVVAQESASEVAYCVLNDTPLTKVKTSFSEKLDLPLNSLKFMFNGRKINDNDTPMSLMMEELDVIEVFQEKTNVGESSSCKLTPLQKSVTPDFVKYIKISFKINVQFLKTDNPDLIFNEHVGMSYTLKKVKENVLKHLSDIYKEKLTVPLEDFVFLFDNAYVEDDATPIGLAMEKEDIIEVFENPNKKLVTEFLESPHTPRKVMGEYIQGINVALQPARVIHDPEDANSPEFHHSTPELAQVCKEQLLCIKDNLLPELNKIIQTRKPNFPSDIKLPEFTKIGQNLKENHYIHSVDCMKEVKEVLRRFEMATEYFGLLKEKEQAQTLHFRKDLSRNLKKCFKDMTKKMPQEAHADEDPSENFTIFVGPARNATPENYLQCRPILEVLEVGRCTKFQDLANTYFDAIGAKNSNFVMRYNNKEVDPRTKVLSGIELLLKNHYIVIEILGQIEDTRDIDSLVDFIEHGNEEGKKKKKRNKKKKALSNKENISRKFANEEEKLLKINSENGVVIPNTKVEEENKDDMSNESLESLEKIREKKKKNLVKLEKDVERLQKKLDKELEKEPKAEKATTKTEEVEADLIKAVDEVMLMEGSKKHSNRMENLTKAIKLEEDSNLIEAIKLEWSLKSEAERAVEYNRFISKIQTGIATSTNSDLTALNDGILKSLKQSDIEFFNQTELCAKAIAAESETNPDLETKRRFYLVKNGVTPKKKTQLTSEEISFLRDRMKVCMECLQIPTNNINEHNEVSLLRIFEDVCWPLASWFVWVENLYTWSKNVGHPKLASFHFETLDYVMKAQDVKLQFEMLALLNANYEYMRFNNGENESLIEALEDAYTERIKKSEKVDVDSLVDFIESKDKQSEVKETKHKKKISEKSNTKKKKVEERQFVEDLNGADFTFKAQHHFIQDAQAKLVKQFSPNTDETTWLEIAAMKVFMVIETQANIELTVYSIFPNVNWHFKSSFEELFKTLYGNDDKNYKCRKLKENTIEAKLTALIELGEKEGQSVGIETPVLRDECHYATVMFEVFLKHFEEHHQKNLENANHVSALKILKGAAERAVVCFSKGIGVKLEIEGLHKGLNFSYAKTYEEVRDDLQKHAADEKKKKGKVKTGKKSQSRKQKSASPEVVNSAKKSNKKEDIESNMKSTLKTEGREIDTPKTIPVKNQSEERRLIFEKVKILEDELKNIDMAIQKSTEKKDVEISNCERECKKLLITQAAVKDEEGKVDNEIEETLKALELLREQKTKLCLKQIELEKETTKCMSKKQDLVKCGNIEIEKLQAGKIVLNEKLESLQSKLHKNNLKIEIPSGSESPEERSTSSSVGIDEKSSVSNKLLDHLEKTIKRYSKELECPICLITVSVPAYKCDEEHLICGKCQPKVNHCPVCRIPYTEPRRRHRYAEKDVEELNRLIKERDDIINDTLQEGKGNVTPEEEKCKVS